MSARDMLSLAARLREYKNNPHHINPMSEGFGRLIDDCANVLVAERQRAVRSPNPHLLIAAKTILSQWDDPRRARTQYTAQLIQELRAAVDEAESVPNAGHMSNTTEFGVSV